MFVDFSKRSELEMKTRGKNLSKSIFKILNLIMSLILWSSEVDQMCSDIRLSDFT